MTTQFNRVYSIQFTKRGSSVGFEFTDLRIQFEVVRDIVGYPNMAEISLWGLSEKTHSEIADPTRTDYLFLSVGYGDNPVQIFAGDIVNVHYERDGAERITRIFAKDGLVSLEKQVAQTYEQGTSVQQILDQFLPSIDLIAGHVSDSIKNTKRGDLGPVVLSGTGKDALDSLFKVETGFAHWSVQKGTLTAIEQTAADQTVGAVEISTATGMLNSPEITDLGANVKCLMRPDIEPNRLIKIISEAPQFRLGERIRFERLTRTLGDGLFKVQKITHSGDSRGSDWTSSIIGRII